MKLLRLLVAFACFSALPAAMAAVTECRVDSLGRFQVSAEIPAGHRHAVLEFSPDVSAGSWRRMLACTTDGRAARATFRLPIQSQRGFTRVATGTATDTPGVELQDPDLVTLRYGAPIEESAKIAMLGNAAARMREWSSLPAVTYHANLIAWAKTHPDVADAVLSPTAGNISIRFKDGDICVLLNPPRDGNVVNLPLPPGTGVPTAAAASFAPRTVAIGSLPGSNRAVTAFSLESHFPNSAPTIRGWLAGKGYAADNFHSTTVQQVMQWSGPGSPPLGVLFWHAHGCSYQKEDGSEGIGLITRELTGVTHPVYGEMRENGELMLAIDKGQDLPYYGITSKFIRNRMSFAPHSLVMIDACYAGHPDLGNAFIAAGAGTYVSWDWLSGPASGTPCLKIFDRLLGTNSEPPISEPKERSFSLGAVRQWMTLFGYDEDPSPRYKDQARSNSKLIWYHHPTQPANILLPSVMRVLAEAGDDAEPFSRYLIEGDFGPDPGTLKRRVSWGGQTMNVLRWDAMDGIVIRIPNNPPQGEIQVTISKDFPSHSNKVPISEWEVPFKYEVLGQGSLGTVMNLNVKFRGDIHGSRGMPEMEPQYLPVMFSNMADCTGTVTASGTWQKSASTTVIWSGGSKLTSQDWNAGGSGVIDRAIVNSGVLQIKQGGALQFSLQAGGPFTETERWIDHEGGVHETISEPTMGLEAAVFLFAEPLSFNPTTSRLASGNRSFWSDTGSATLTWPGVTPHFAPNDNTPR